jgi:hypothetical protein
MSRSIVSVLLGLTEVPQSLVGLFAATVSVVVTAALCYLLERIKSLLPPTVALYPDFDTAEDHLLSAAEVYSQLDDVTVLELERLALLIRLA